MSIVPQTPVKSIVKNKKGNNSIAVELKSVLQGIITKMAEDPSDFVVSPGVDFTRKRKLDFETLMNLILSMKGGSISKEMFDFFGGDVETASASAFVQQRNKLKIEAFEFLFNKFNEATSTLDTNTYDGYRLLAVDGSDINIATNPESETYFKKVGFNQFHLNAVYDILNKTYFDVLIQPAPKEHEIRAAIEMIDRNVYPGKTLLIADRGYESFNMFAHVLRKDNLDFLIRAKHKQGMREISSLPLTDADFDVETELRTTQRKEDMAAFKAGTARHIHGKSKYGKEKQKVTWDLESPYKLKFSIVRFKISDDTYETIITSLDRDTFPPEKIKELYHLRWGIETSFRELKYAICVINFHAKREDFIQQEIFAMLTMYNFCERITLSVIVKQSDDNKHTYQVNFTMAIHICRDFFSLPARHPPPDVFAQIAKFVLPVRPGRADKRKIKPKSAIMFTYRIAA